MPDLFGKISLSLHVILQLGLQMIKKLIESDAQNYFDSKSVKVEVQLCTSLETIISIFVKACTRATAMLRRCRVCHTTMIMVLYSTPT